MASRLAQRQPSAGALDLFAVLEDSITSSESIPLPSSSPASHRADDTHTSTTIAPPITGLSTAAAASSSVTESSVLAERSLQQVQNLRPPEVTSPESLANQLDQFHISNPKKTILDTKDQKPLSRGPHTRLPLDENTFIPPSLSLVAPKAIQPLGRDPELGQVKLRQPSGAVPGPRPKLVQEAPAAPSPTPCPPAISRAVDQQELERHKAGDFDYLLSIPASSAAAEKYYRESGKSADIHLASNTADPSAKLYFGCTLVESRIEPATKESGEDAGVENHCVRVHTLLATPIDKPEQASAKTDIKELETASSVTMMPEHVSPSSGPEPQITVLEPGEVAAKLLLPRESSPSRAASPFPRPLSSARIEDTFEALDDLEEQLEALHEVVRVERVPSPEKLKRAPSTKQSGTVKRVPSTTKKPVSRAGSVRVSGADVRRNGSVRKSVSIVLNKTDQKPTRKTTSPSTKRVASTRPRPVSLIEPRQPAKTAPMFELPGDAVARRLKEQRETRLAKVEADKAERAAQASALQRAPQEEEERRRREFKARPIRAALVTPSSVPRETVASRARQAAKAASAPAEQCESSAATTSLGKKRGAVGTAASPSRRPLSGVMDSQQQQQRGRDTTAAGSAASRNKPAASSIRGTSTSTGSTNISKSSSGVSNEDMQQQRRRAREIYRRDNSLVEERERDQREREMMAKIARQEAAERSRQLSREWAERRQTKRSSVVGPPSSPARNGKVAVR
ncbi:hypothetical protein MAPG_09713 [Magnaporthiopsis poae ATCC 64411]|uniref:Carboxylesterase family protein n=1 Tax=Magnaporthiopsis poae (strain ATCC 64411 / 73-15) TaxID=644358 RepID=A0A0C4EAN6_MAGP6|nr:hypothetical protein MAPG_09713 [Magnaporthiopsis poae ATCC 64411]